MNSSSRTRLNIESSSSQNQPPLIVNQYPGLEIRNYQREEPRISPKTEDDSLSPSKHENGSSTNKYALDYMPRFVIKQMNERRSLNTTMISASNGSLNGGGSSVMGLRDAVVESNGKGGMSTITTTITPYNLYNAKNANELVESTTKELNRRSSGKSNKIHSKMSTNMPPSSSSSSNSQKQHQKVINSLQSTQIIPPTSQQQLKNTAKSSQGMSSNGGPTVFSNSQLHQNDQGPSKTVHDESATSHNYYGPSFAYANVSGGRASTNTQQVLVQPQFSLPRSNNSYPSQLSQSTSNIIRPKTLYK